MFYVKVERVEKTETEREAQVEEEQEPKRHCVFRPLVQASLSSQGEFLSLKPAQE